MNCFLEPFLVISGICSGVIGGCGIGCAIFWIALSFAEWVENKLT